MSNRVVNPRFKDLDFKICSYGACHKAFKKVGDNWYSLSRMHQDRIGSGPFEFCSRMCTVNFLLNEMVDATHD